jgi:hypothetical protein
VFGRAMPFLLKLELDIVPLWNGLKLLFWSIDTFLKDTSILVVCVLLASVVYSNHNLMKSLSSTLRQGTVSMTQLWLAAATKVAGALWCGDVFASERRDVETSIQHVTCRNMGGS